MHCVRCKTESLFLYRRLCGDCLWLAVQLLEKHDLGIDPVAPHKRRVYLWESMCATYQSKAKVKLAGSTPEALLTDYKRRQVKRGRLEYVAEVDAFPDRALAMAKQVIDLRVRTH